MFKRSLKLQNMSSIPIDIDWRVFFIDQDDKRLIDVNIVFDDINEADLMKIAGINVSNNSSSKQMYFVLLLFQINELFVFKKWMWSAQTIQPCLTFRQAWIQATIKPTVAAPIPQWITMIRQAMSTSSSCL